MQQTANLPQDSITSGVNESRFIAHIQELFSSSTVALGEIVQNARRAQATKVMFDWNHDGDLIVTDDGIGISDFRTLVIIAESGWSDELMADEKPFGIGFASVCFGRASDGRVQGKAGEFQRRGLGGEAPHSCFASELYWRYTTGAFRSKD